MNSNDFEVVMIGHRRLVRELDVLLNGEAGAAEQASLCDLVAQVRRERIRRTEREEIGKALLDAWRDIAAVSGSALLAGERKSQTPDQRACVYVKACSALAAVGSAYYDLTGKHAGVEEATEAKA